MAASRRRGTLTLLSRLSKRALNATPEASMGMSARHFMALNAIPGELPQQDLAEALCIDANNTVLVLNELEAAGWVVRVRDPSDRRRHLVRLTPEGRTAHEQALAARDEFEDDVLGPLDEDQRQQLHDLLSLALEPADRDADSAASRASATVVSQ
jgi:DNA-binding MarR family transcriptional regulator